MGRYDKASAKTELAIQDAYWKIYEKRDTDTVTVDEICDEAGVHRSTFYYHFRSVEAVSDSIKERQMSLLRGLFERTGGKNVDFTAFIPAFQELFDENERYLVPLVIEYGDREFSFQYRSFLEDMMFEHLKISYDNRDTRTAGVLATVISGLVDMFLLALSNHTITLEDANMLSNGMINTGLRSVLRDGFGIHIGFTMMKLPQYP